MIVEKAIADAATTFSAEAWVLNYGCTPTSNNAGFIFFKSASAFDKKVMHLSKLTIWFCY